MVVLICLGMWETATQYTRATALAPHERRIRIESTQSGAYVQPATLNRQLKIGLDDQRLAELVIALRQDARLRRLSETAESVEPQVICSLGLRSVHG
jgi:hypothetical protein